MFEQVAEGFEAARSTEEFGKHRLIHAVDSLWTPGVLSIEQG
jgi:hypothetical protein